VSPNYYSLGRDTHYWLNPLYFMAKPKEYISKEAGWEDAWICICGNTPPDGGFYPCDSEGNEMEPTIESDWDNLYVCADCGRIINQDTLEVIGRNPHPKMLV
jgi:hypothetical protein